MRNKQNCSTKSTWAVLVLVNFDCFAPGRCEHYYCSAMRKSVEAPRICTKNQQIEHTPVHSLLWLLQRKKTRSSTFFLKKNFVGHMFIFGATDTPFSDFWWRLHWVSGPEWAPLLKLCGGVRDHVHSSTFNVCSKVTFGVRNYYICFTNSICT